MPPPRCCPALLQRGYNLDVKNLRGPARGEEIQLVLGDRGRGSFCLPGWHPPGLEVPRAAHPGTREQRGAGSWRIPGGSS